ncbi:MAG: GAF domain-containing protein [Mycoplasmataceae bacterium]|nr:GAF domain-containing protein [Mycoplasmataceae bacterium]
MKPMHKIRKNENLKINLNHLFETVKSLLNDEDDLISGLANVSSVINAYITNINWCGFYLIKNNKLVLGPFQGLPACTRIDIGKGVCGTAAKTKTPLIVPNVHKFPGHIACDVNSQSEVVIPLFKNSKIFGVLDIDSPKLNRFKKAEVNTFIKIAALINKFIGCL